MKFKEMDLRTRILKFDEVVALPEGMRVWVEECSNLGGYWIKLTRFEAALGDVVYLYNPETEQSRKLTLADYQLYFRCWTGEADWAIALREGWKGKRA